MNKRFFSSLAASSLISFTFIACAPEDITRPTAPDQPLPGVDTDGDGLSDLQEIEGWTVTLDRDGFGLSETIQVSSDPNLADTDGDGLDDFAEFTSRINPTVADTDGDSLSDLEETTRYFSNPNTVDTDGDARAVDATGVPTGFPNPQLFDGNELHVVGTSPTLADTDGDAISDYDEVVGGGTHPLIADVPNLEVEFVGNVDVALDGSVSDNCTDSNTQFRATLERQQSAFSNTSASSTEHVLETGASVSSTVSGSPFPPSVSASVTATASVSESTTNSSSTSFTRESASESQQEFQNSVERSCFSGQETTGGTVTLGFKIKNPTPIGFTLENINLTLLRRISGGNRAFETLGTVDAIESPVDMAPQSSTGTLTVAVEVPAQKAIDLLQNPAGLFFEVGTYSIRDESGRSYAFITETALGRTGLITVDYGDERPAERFLVATNVERQVDGSSAGLTSAQVMALLGREIETETGYLGNEAVGRVLTSVDGLFTSEADRRFWVVYGSASGLADPTVNFEDIVLQRGQTLNLVLVKDTDGDGLFDREEYVHGTDPNQVDTDGDGLSDFEETKLGWTSLFDNRRVFSSPLAADSDGDLLTDAEERFSATRDADGVEGKIGFGIDPLNGDTDHDGRNDLLEVSRHGALSAALPEVTSGSNRFEVRAKDGGFYQWGRGSSAEFGYFIDDELVAEPVFAEGQWLQFTGTGRMTFGIEEGGVLRGFGRDDFMLAGPEPFAPEWYNRAVVQVENNQELEWSKVFSGERVAYAISTDGFLYAHGANNDGLLGIGSIGDFADSRFVKVDSSERFANVASGERVTAAVTTDGRLFTWGSNAQGATGLGLTEGHQLVPTAASSDDDWSKVAVSGGRVFALKTSGELVGFGDNSGGLGLGEDLAEVVTTPTFVRDNVRAIFAQGRVAHVVSFEGELFGLGDAEDGSLGFGNAADKTSFTQIGSDSDWATIAYGTGGNVIATKTDGAEHMWGLNLGGELGFGDTFPRPTATLLPSVRWR